jgi:predicted AAA+ superfamily ATPase
MNLTQTTILDRGWEPSHLVKWLEGRRLLWLSGPRGAGKTTLVKRLGGELADYVDCESPKGATQLRWDEAFLSRLKKPILILDEVHRAPDLLRFLEGCLTDPGRKAIAVSSALSEIPFSLP